MMYPSFSTASSISSITEQYVSRIIGLNNEAMDLFNNKSYGEALRNLQDTIGLISKVTKLNDENKNQTLTLPKNANISGASTEESNEHHVSSNRNNENAADTTNIICMFSLQDTFSTENNKKITTLLWCEISTSIVLHNLAVLFRELKKYNKTIDILNVLLDMETAIIDLLDSTWMSNEQMTLLAKVHVSTKCLLAEAMMTMISCNDNNNNCNERSDNDHITRNTTVEDIRSNEENSRYQIRSAAMSLFSAVDCAETYLQHTTEFHSTMYYLFTTMGQVLSYSGYFMNESQNAFEAAASYQFEIFEGRALVVSYEQSQSEDTSCFSAAPAA